MKMYSLLSTITLTFAVMMMTACSTGDSAAINGDWQLISFGPADNPIPAASGVETLITFGSNGRVKGNVGCNSFGGEFKTNGDQITFDPLVATLRGCPGMVGEQESGLFKVFVGNATFKLDGNTLTITSADGKSLVVLKRK
jgi:heat shock protein HslJ